MDTTECFGFPYPQCDPPLTKDASDIEQLRDLALAIDTAVQDFNDDITTELVRPDAARLFNGTALTSTLAENTFFLDTVTFDNTAGDSMSDTTNGVIRIQRAGWYLVWCWVESLVATDVQTRVRFIVNGTEATNFQGPSGLVTAGQQHLSVEEMLNLQAGDGVTVQTRNGAPGTSVTYTARVAVQLVAPNV